MVTAAALKAAHARAPRLGVPAQALVLQIEGAHLAPEDNPAYLSAQAMRWVRALGVDHLLLELPSVDRGQDDGLLQNHRIFRDLAPGCTDPSPAGAHRTITEFIAVPPGVAPGDYVLNLQLPAFVLDAAPSRPRLFRLTDPVPKGHAP